MVLPNYLPPAMAKRQHRRSSHARAPLGWLRAQDLGPQLAVAGLHGIVESAKLRCRYDADRQGGCGVGSAQGWG